ncbi:hypothetical protein [Thermoflexus hugenholtzii]
MRTWAGWPKPLFLSKALVLLLLVAVGGAGWALHRRTQASELWRMGGWILLGGWGLALLGLLLLGLLYLR